MTPNATLLFDANIRLHNLDSNEPINIERIIDAVE
jgi:hypothetical protein